jgi:mono/diheme cytochrome c family protein
MRSLRFTSSAKQVSKLASAISALIVAVGCHTDMWVQPKTAPLDESTFFNDKSASRPLVAGTVARGHLAEDTAYYTGRDDNGKLLTKMPIRSLSAEQMKAFLLRGEERFNIYCSPCHGRLGNGMGMISKRGLDLRRPPANYHTPRLRNMPIGHFYDVITHGSGAMYSYASRVEPQDRWAIAAYIRALQLSQNATAEQFAAVQPRGGGAGGAMGLETQ